MCALVALRCQIVFRSDPVRSAQALADQLTILNQREELLPDAGFTNLVEGANRLKGSRLPEASHSHSSQSGSRSDRMQFAFLGIEMRRYHFFARGGLGSCGAGTHARRPPDFPPTIQRSGGRAPRGFGFPARRYEREAKWPGGGAGGGFGGSGGTSVQTW